MTIYQLTSNARPEDLAKLVDDAMREGEVVLTRDGLPVARLLPILQEQTHVQKRVIGTAKGLIRVPPDFNEPLEDMRPYMEGPGA